MLIYSTQLAIGHIIHDSIYFGLVTCSLGYNTKAVNIKVMIKPTFDGCFIQRSISLAQVHSQLSIRVQVYSHYIHVCMFNQLFYPHGTAQPAHVDPTLDSCTRYPSLLGGQGQCRFKACPRLLRMTGAAGIEPQTSKSRVQCLNCSATHSMALQSRVVA